MFLPGSGVRVSVQTAPFMPAGVFIAYYYYRKTSKNKYLIACAAICTAIFFTKTVGIWIGLIGGSLLLAFFFGKRLISILLPVIVIFIALLLVVQLIIPEMQGDIEKAKSYDVKSQQVENGLRLFQDNVLLGVGLGHRLNLDDRGDTAPIIEVLPVLILIDGGVVGFLIYLFIYFMPLIKFAASKIKPDALIIVIASHISVVIAGFSNPYFISGGTGLFFVVLILVFLRLYKSRAGVSITVGNT
jgi:O-antigen ligase